MINVVETSTLSVTSPHLACFRLAPAMPPSSSTTHPCSLLAERLEMRSILHVDYESTGTELTSTGLQSNDPT
jgi:hypothetical protein